MESATGSSVPGGDRVVVLTPTELEAIIERAAAKGAKKAAAETLDEAQRRFVYQVGIGVLKKAAVVVGVGLLLLGLWLAGRGEMPR